MTEHDQTGEGTSNLNISEYVSDSPDGDAAAPFSITADIEETRKDRYKDKLDTYVLGPLRIIRSDPRAVIGFSLLGLYIMFGIIAVFVLEPTYTFEGDPYVQPFQTWDHPLGTNNLGQDLMYQGFYSIIPLGQMMIAGALFTIILGTVVGIISGYKGGGIDRVLSTITDVFINLPGLPLVIVLTVLFQPQNEFVIGIMLTVASWAGLARAIRSQILTLREEAFIEAARAMGIPLHKLLYKEILPHMAPYIVVNTAGAAQSVIFAAVGLYFLGILPFTGANWGTMLSQSYGSDSFWHLDQVHWLIVTLAFIIGISIALILLAQSLDRVFNPRVRARHAERAVIEDEEEQTNIGVTRI